MGRGEGGRRWKLVASEGGSDFEGEEAILLDDGFIQVPLSLSLALSVENGTSIDIDTEKLF